MKNFIIILLTLLTSVSSMAQLISTNGASILSSTGTYWSLSGGTFIVKSPAADKVVFSNLNISNTATLIVDPQSYVVVNDAFTNNGSLLLKSTSAGTASLLTRGSVTGSNSQVERYINGISWAWHFLSSPVNSQSISGSFTPSGAGNDYDFYTWYEPQMIWVNFKNTTTAPTWNTANGNTNFLPGRGYLVAYETNNTTKTFGGVLNSGQVNYALTHGGSSAYQYYNLVGNPYPCSIDWKAPSGWNMTNLSGTDKSYWVWNDATGNYGTYTSTTSGNTGTNGVTRYISGGQGFFVLAATTGNLSMNDGVKVGNIQPFLKNGESMNEELKLKLTSSATSFSDEAIVEFNNSDPLSGSEKFNSMYTVAPELWTEKNDINYSISFMGDLTTEKIIPVTIKAGLPGTYTLTACQLESFRTSPVIRLEDRLTGIFTNLAVTPFITLQVDQPAVIDDRIFLHVQEVAVGSTPEIADDFKVYVQDGMINIQSLQLQSGKVTVTDMAGRTIASSRVESGTTTRIGIPGHTGVYIVSVLTTKGISNTKIIVK